MKIIRKITSLILALVVLLSANGFFVEKYLCSGCHHQHSDIAFFEFGEISHNHNHCENCDGHDNSCSCQMDEHLKHSTISFYSLEQLFFSSCRTDISEIQLLLIPQSFVFSPTYYLRNDIELNYLDIFKLPPLLKTNAGSTIFGAVISVFRQ